MGANEALVVTLVALLASAGILVGILLFTAALMFLPPLLLRRRIAGWTAGGTCYDVWEALERGATRGGFQIRPASFLFEADKATAAAPQQAIEIVARAFASGWGRKVELREQNAIVVSMRFLPWVATDLGWVGVAWAFPNGPGSIVRMRFRSTYMWPVITFFLTLRLKMWLLDRLL